LFEALKENVYQEVKNLITANESRPHFLIQLFRELQLISSDPLRQRTLQSIQELYSRYVESAIIHEENNSNSLVAASEVPSRSMNNFEGQQQQQQQSVNSSSRSNDLNNIGYDFPTSQSTPRVSWEGYLQNLRCFQ
jgi:pericentriolar material 1 protein